jgi:hypothetical protein
MLLPDLPDATRDAIDHAAAVLKRSKAVLAAANLSADRAQQQLEAADARADVLHAQMADVKYARPAA